MGIGNMIAKVFSPMIATRIGGFVLVGIGAWVLYQFFRGDKKEEMKQEEKVWKLEIASLGLVIQILRKPTVADFDRSGTISAGEALLLGIALSVDSFGAGIGASLLGYAPAMMAMLVAVMSSLFLFIGMQMGTMLSNMRWLQRFTFLPGVLLIIIGLWKM